MNEETKDSFTIGTNNKDSKGVIKVYFDASNWKEAHKKIASALLLYSEYVEHSPSLSELKERME